HLAITVSPDGNLNTWIDGNQKLTDVDTNDLSSINTTFEAIGATSWGDPGMNGSVDEFRIWSGELSAAEVGTNFASGPNNLVPEPSGILLTLAGGFLFLRRRRA
ncbi:MAG: LamG-like jellyroll fold domain-containing protein, partial [Akkermansiaceae bacterium]